MTRVNLHGLTLKFESGNPALRQRFAAVYGHLPPANAARPKISIRWQLLDAATAPPPPGWPVLHSDPLVSTFGNERRVAVRIPKYGLITVELASGRVTGQVTPNCLSVSGAFEDVMLISLAPLYRRRGWFPLHAFAARHPNGAAALISGQMGAGKTTTGLALLCAGWKLLSNDSPLLRLRGGSVEVLAYPGRLSAYDDSLARFAALRRFIPTEKGREAARTKQVFGAEEVFENPWAERETAGALFFPQVTPGLARSELEPLEPAQALLQLLPQAVEGWDKSQVTTHLRLLGRLVEQAPCYRLRLAPDVAALPDLLAQGLRGG